jgi:thymidylate kinase
LPRSSRENLAARRSEKPFRQILLHSGTQDLKPLSELLLYYASRHQNLCHNILPALERGQWVLCDRYADASLAYQGYGRGLDLNFIEATQPGRDWPKTSRT